MMATGTKVAKNENKKATKKFLRPAKSSNAPLNLSALGDIVIVQGSVDLPPGSALESLYDSIFRVRFFCFIGFI